MIYASNNTFNLQEKSWDWPKNSLKDINTDLLITQGVWSESEENALDGFNVSHIGICHL